MVVVCKNKPQGYTYLSIVLFKLLSLSSGPFIILWLIFRMLISTERMKKEKWRMSFRLWFCQLITSAKAFQQNLQVEITRLLTSASPLIMKIDEVQDKTKFNFLWLPNLCSNQSALSRDLVTRAHFLSCFWRFICYLLLWSTKKNMFNWISLVNRNPMVLDRE